MAPKGPDGEEWTVGCLIAIIVAILIITVMVVTGR
jgi:hypothetical protein